MLRYFLIISILLSLQLSAEEGKSTLLSQNDSPPQRIEFLTQREYGKALYSNPRGIGCIQCHGQNGNGGIIGYTKQKGKQKPILAPKITNIKFIRFENALKNGKGFMPKYNLSASEMVALYSYLNPNQIKSK